MIKEIIFLIPFLGLSVIINIVLGMYYNIGTKKIKFNKNKFWGGILKAIIIAFSAIGLAVIFEYVAGNISIGNIELLPDDLIKTAIILYVSKAIINLKNILIKE